MEILILDFLILGLSPKISCSQRDIFFLLPSPASPPPTPRPSQQTSLQQQCLAPSHTCLGTPCASGNVEGKRWQHCCCRVASSGRPSGIKANYSPSVVHGPKWSKLPKPARPVLKACIFWKKKQKSLAGLLAYLRLTAFPRSKLELKSHVQIIL